MNMADAGLQESEQEIEKKIEEVRQRFKTEYVQESSEKYDPRDVERLEKDDSFAQSYLEWRHFVLEDALKMIDESFQWRKEYGLNDLTESSIPKWMFETGAVYLHGYDKEGNKLCWFKVKLHVKDAKTFVDKKKYVAFWLERYAKREPGMPLTVVFDMSDSGIGNIDMEFVKYVVNCFKIYYPKFLSKMIMYEMPWIMNAAWKIVKSWLGPEAINKLKFVSKNEVQTYIDVEYLPPHMGGTDPFKYCYPPLPDDDFQSPICENGGPIVSEDENESKDGEPESKDQLELSFSSESSRKPKKWHSDKMLVKKDSRHGFSLLISPPHLSYCPGQHDPNGYPLITGLPIEDRWKVNFAEDSFRIEETDKVDATCRSRGTRRPSTTFKGQMLHISPAEELCFGSKDGERKCLIVLNNITRNQVAFKVRTTAPEKYRVKPSNTSCEPGASVDIVVSLHGAYQASPQDRFLVMAAEMEFSAGVSSTELSQFWKEVPRAKIMEHRLRCHVFENIKPVVDTLSDNPLGLGSNNQQDLHSTLIRVVACNSRLEQKLEQCLWVQKVMMVLLSILMAFSFSSLYLLYVGERTP